MKILLAGVFNSKSTNVSQANALRRQGHEVIQYPYRETGLDAARRDSHMCMTAEMRKVDLVILSKCNGVSVEVVRQIQGCGIRVHLWWMDSMANFDREARQKVDLCDRSFFSRHGVYREGLGISDMCEHLQEGFDPDVDRPVDVPYERDFCFIGSIHANRGKYLEGGDIPRVTGVYGAEHARVVSSTRINLNFTMGDGCSDRAYKVMASGGFLLTQPWEGMEDDFTPGEDFDIFMTPSGLRDSIEWWLADEVTREGIAASGRRAVQKFSRDAWAKKIVEMP